MATDNPDVVQVSLNLLDTGVTPMHVVYERVRALAADGGVDVVESEIVGLLPLGAVVATAQAHVRARELSSSQIVEARLLQALSSAEPPPPASGQAGA